MSAAGFHRLGALQAGGAAEHDEVDERVGAEPVGAVHRHAGGFADGHKARHHVIGIAVLQGEHLAHVVRRHAAHVVVHGRQHGDRRAAQVDAGEDLGVLGDARQALGDDLRVEMIEVQVDVFLIGAHAAALADLDRHGARDNVAGGEVLGVGRIALHEALALAIGEVGAFTARAFRDQHTGAIDAGGVELHELHVLQRQAGAQHHGVAVAGAGVGADVQVK